MPLYLYDGPGGRTIEEHCRGTPPDTITIRGLTFRRRAVQAFAITGASKAPVMGDEILRGYHVQECALGSRFRTRLPAQRIKEVWANDGPD